MRPSHGVREGRERRKNDCELTRMRLRAARDEVSWVIQ